MSIWVSLFIADFINNMMISSQLLLEYKSENEKLSKNMLTKYLISILFLTIVSSLLMASTSRMIKTIVKILLSAIIFTKIFNNKFSKVIMSIFLIYILCALYDTLFGLIYIGVFQLPTEIFNNSWSFILLANGLIAGSTILTLKIKHVSNFIKNISDWYSQKNIINLIVNMIICVVSVWFFINKNTSGTVPLLEYIGNFIVIATIIIFVTGFFKENSDKNQLKEKYDSLIDYAKTYEQEVIEKSKWQHEYENQLIIVKSKINEENDEAHKYIDKLLRNKPTDENTKWLTKLSKFPDIGIKGLLHYKICQMKDLDINVYVDVINDVAIKKNSKMSKILEDNLQDISRILGVYLDNAIQATQQAHKKYIICEFKTSNDNIVFQISNTYRGKLDLEKMGQEKFTTKGRGHGYGLSLTRDILEKNDYLSQNREINGMYYVQQLIIDIKKKV